MGKRKVTIKLSVAESISRVAWYIESKGMVATAERFSDSVYDFFDDLADKKKSYRSCREKGRALLGFKCVNFNKRYTVVLIESDLELIIL